MTTSIELRVVVATNSEADNAADRLEAEVKRALRHLFPAENFYVERSCENHPMPWAT